MIIVITAISMGMVTDIPIKQGMSTIERMKRNHSEVHQKLIHTENNELNLI